MSIPRDVKSILESKEEVLKTWKSGILPPIAFFGGWGVYATNRRLILKKGGLIHRKVIDLSYTKIGSIEQIKERQNLPAYVFIALGVFYSFFRLITASPVLLFLPGTFMLIGLFLLILKVPAFKLNIAGEKPIILPQQLEPAIKWLKKKVKKKSKKRKPRKHK